MATSKLMLNKARQLKDGTYPLVMQVLHLRKKHLIYSGLYLHPEEFDPQTGAVIANTACDSLCQKSNEKNMAIKAFTTQIANIIAHLEQKGNPYTCKMIVEQYHISNSNASLTRYWLNKIEQSHNLQRYGTAAAQLNTFRSVEAYWGSSLISMEEITPKFIKKYEQHLLSRGLSANTISYYMRNFKIIMNSIVREGWSQADINSLFNGIKTTPRKTIKRAITRHELRNLAQMNLEDEPLLSLARDLFMFSFYTRGMSFVDIAFLRRENISDDMLYYLRKKTKQQLQINLNAPIQTLISRYKSASHYLFPIVSSDDCETAYKEYRSSLRRINKALKTIGFILKITTPLTTYVARHSWATQAKERGFPVSIISEGLGHTSENITQIYLKKFEHSILDQANDLIADL